MKKILIFIGANLIASGCWAFSLVEDLNVPPQVAGAIEGNVILNTDIKAPPRVEIEDKREHKRKVTVDVSKMKTINFGKFKIPADYRSIKIIGDKVATREQALKYLRKTSSGKAQLNCSMKDIVEYYYDEAEKEGVRPDLAFCQAIVETGSFRFSGTVRPNQNNFCGLGTTGKGVHGAKFGTAREGVRAHIQHLLAYCQKDKPKGKIVDPRYDLVHKIRMSRGLITNWYGLNGTWAMGANYCEKIMAQYYAMVTMK